MSYSILRSCRNKNENEDANRNILQMFDCRIRIFEVSYWAIYWKEISQIWLLYYIIIYKELEMLRTL